ncbi:MAG: hypothetical protein O3C05_02115, partial [Proteobacteria bacterium]|nr:hypothetical protein [Pseudomonadota bacterium]
MLCYCKLEAHSSSIADSGILPLYKKEEVRINRDGTSEHRTEMQIKILSKSGISLLNLPGMIFPSYNASMQTFEIVQSNILSEKGLITAIQAKKKHLKGSTRVFEIDCNDLRVDSVLHLNYIIKTHTPILQDQFSYEFGFDIPDYFQSFDLNIESDLPLYCKYNDPYDALLVTSCDINIPHNKIHITSEAFGKINKLRDAENLAAHNFWKKNTNASSNDWRGYINENFMRQKNAERVWLQVSSYKDWSQLSIQLGEIYTNVMKQTLPQIFQEISSQSQGIKDFEEKIDFIITSLQKKLSASQKLSIAPRSLEEIANTLSANSKDFVIAAAAIF